MIASIVGMLVIGMAGFNVDACGRDPGCSDGISRAIATGFGIGAASLVVAAVLAQVRKDPRLLYWALLGYMVALGVATSGIDRAVGR